MVYRTGSIEVLQNWLAVNKSKTCSIVVENSTLKGRKIFVYAGNMGVAQGLSVFIDLADSLSTQKSIGFLFVGRGTAVVSLRQAVKARGLDNILIYDEIEPQEIHALYQQCDVGIISLDKRHKTHNIPGKFLSYMQSGLPVLAAINSGNDLEHIINSNKVGCVSTNHSVYVLNKLLEEIVEADNEIRETKKEEAAQPAPVVEEEVEKQEIPREVFTQKLLDELECGVNPHKLMCLEKSNETSNTSSDTPHTDR